MLLNGNLDSVDYDFKDGWVAHGWAADLDDPSRPVEVEILEGERVLANGTAANFRQDVAAAGIRKGFAAFRIPLDEERLANAERHRLSIRRQGTGAAIVPPVPFRLTRFLGALDPVEGVLISGWACNTLNSGTPVALELLADGHVVDRGVADQFRPDLARLGMGNAHHGFRWVVPRSVIDGHPHRLSARVANASTVLKNNAPHVLVLPDRVTPRARQLLRLREAAREYLAQVDRALVAEGRQLSPAKAITTADLLLDSLDPAPTFEAESRESEAAAVTVAPEVIGFT